MAEVTQQNQQRPPNDNEVIVIPLSKDIGPLQTIVAERVSWEKGVLAAIMNDGGVNPERTYEIEGPIQPNGRRERTFLSGITGFYTNYGTGIVPVQAKSE